MTRSNIDFKEIIFIILAIAFVSVLPHIGITPAFTYVVPILVFIWLHLTRRGETFASIGLRINRMDWHPAVIGILAGIALFCFLQYIFFPLLDKLTPLAAADLDDFKTIRHNTTMYIFVLSMGWLVGGLYEEIVFHGFIFSRLEKVLPTKHSTSFAVVLTALIFAVYHVQQGMSGMLNALIAGLGYQLVMLRYERNIWYAFFAHGMFDTIAITNIYLGYW